LRILLAELSALSRAGVLRAQALMRTRDLEDLLRTAADAAIDQAIDTREDGDAIDRAVSSVRAAADAKQESTRALALWIEHLDRVDELSGATTRFLALQS